MKTATSEILGLLRSYEAANMLWTAPDGSWPIVWSKAKGATVWDAEGRKYIDLTAAFGVAAAGHGNPRVVAAGKNQLGKLVHAMGDVHPHALKGELARALSRRTFERWNGSRGKTIFVNSGFEAVEVALKTALLATSRRKVLAFTGGYHGLGYGALNATHRDYFRAPFRAQLNAFATFVPFPRIGDDLGKTAERIERLLRAKTFGAILVEPIQGRGGIRVPPEGFLPLLRELCDRHGTLLILDEIFTGLGRTGAWFACDHSGTCPDLICLGKALTGGFPLAVCVGRHEVMDRAWPASHGEAVHTSTFQGHPVGCAMALAQLKEIERLNLPKRSAELGAFLLRQLTEKIGDLSCVVEVRGKGLMVGVQLKESGVSAFQVVQEMLQRGFILLPEGDRGEVVSLTPPLTISKQQLAATVSALAKVLRA